MWGGNTCNNVSQDWNLRRLFMQLGSYKYEVTTINVYWPIKIYIILTYLNMLTVMRMFHDINYILSIINHIMQQPYLCQSKLTIYQHVFLNMTIVSTKMFGTIMIISWAIMSLNILDVESVIFHWIVKIWSSIVILWIAHDIIYPIYLGYD